MLLTFLTILLSMLDLDTCLLIPVAYFTIWLLLLLSPLGAFLVLPPVLVLPVFTAAGLTCIGGFVFFRSGC